MRPSRGGLRPPHDRRRADQVRRAHRGPERERIVGVFARERDGGGILTPTDRRDRSAYRIGRREAAGAADGELVVAEPLPGRRHGPPQARVVEVLGRLDDPLAPSLIAIREHGIPAAFSAGALAEADAARPVELGSRADLRDLPLVTIDGEDARDFDDAVWAEPTPDGGWHAVVAIADVAWYVRPGSDLDLAAAERGNSVYFPDRVVPMLPEPLSNDLCSLMPGADRACLAFHLWLDAAGRLRRHEVVRGLMRSAARLTYDEVQARADAGGDALTRPLWGAFRALETQRRGRGALDLDLPEFRVMLAGGTPVEVARRSRLDSHRLIEELMIAANVAAAETLGRRRAACLYRIHDRPDPERLDALSRVLESIGAPGLRLARGQVPHPGLFARILDAAAGRTEAGLVNELVLRAQAQAEYAPENIGHFGLGLREYAHFTSPIRRYADLVVHRALIAACSLGDGGGDGGGDFSRLGRHLSMTERRAARAERDTVDRYVARFMRQHVGAVFPGRITGVARFGLFVTLDDSGADGLVPVESLPRDDYRLDRLRHVLIGRRTRASFSLGQRLPLILVDSDPVGAGLVFGLAESAAARGRG